MDNPNLLCRSLISLEKNLQITAFYTMFECEKSGGYAFPGETHDFWECVYVKEGEICVSADERIYNMKKGEVIFHKPMEFHKFHIEKECNAQLFIFTFTMTGKFCAFLENKVLSLTKEQLEMIDSIMCFTREKTKNGTSSKDEYSRVLDILSKNELHMMMLLNSVCRLLLSICDDCCGKSAVSDTENARVYRCAVEYMSENLEKSLSVYDIAEKCCVSTTSLKKIFNEYAGIGIHKLYLKLKMKKATSLLAGGKNTSETAMAVGFSSQGYFSEAFKRETGMSPGCYRKNCSHITHF